MAMQFVLVVLLFLARQVFLDVGAAETTILTTVEPSMALVEEIAKEAQLSRSVSASPRCWALALNALSDLVPIEAGTSAVEFCSAMTQLQQDAVALELARCHVEKSRTPFIVDGKELKANDCAGSNLVDQERVDACLAILDNNSFSIFVQFTLHVQQLCVRFTDELVALRKEQSAIILAQSSHFVTQQVKDLMEKNDNLINKILEQQELVTNQTLDIEENKRVVQSLRTDLESVSSAANNLKSLLRIGLQCLEPIMWFFFCCMAYSAASWLFPKKVRSVVNFFFFRCCWVLVLNCAVRQGYIGRDVESRVTKYISIVCGLGSLSYFLLKIFKGSFENQPAPSQLKNEHVQNHDVHKVRDGVRLLPPLSPPSVQRPKQSRTLPPLSPRSRALANTFTSQRHFPSLGLVLSLVKTLLCHTFLVRKEENEGIIYSDIKQGDELYYEDNRTKLRTPCKVVAIHSDDPPLCYYSIRIQGRSNEKQAEAKNLKRTAEPSIRWQPRSLLFYLCFVVIIACVWYQHICFSSVESIRLICHSIVDNASDKLSSLNYLRESALLTGQYR